MREASAPPRPLRVLVVDDEPLARANLRGLLGKAPDVAHVQECAGGREAIDTLLAEPPDLVFLDVQMPEVDGFAVIREVGPERMPAVIFVTAHDQYAVRAFEVNALDYLLKPFHDARFRQALERARQALDGGRARELIQRLSALLAGHAAVPAAPPAALPSTGYLERLVVKTDERVEFVPVEQIDWCEAEGNYVVLHVGRRSPMIRETLAQVEQWLDPRRFLRIHRSTLVNVERIRHLEPGIERGHVVVLADGTRLRLSPGRKAHVEALLNQSF
ncbi:LytTR family DNA-binding domain-containing protein [Vitiosangium sp. GDMCC 1.1324]|uniref:LytR/AlgR family response regulator transcription factor n=1 Tax=Vitiosangium sp. (strain GDMCC 1.1324) TaxID=2138576 RepID=UPI000D332EC0|nr:LytTR family DNA-binding domain-containing protein [Vitiosangium sp. GDMCC 1.1324]PTL79612.1 DNA-binding response regulator [Vitiosangium sp. GDMCC 1.1324]